MKLDIPYYIRQVLREQRMVYVPGIGTLRLNQSPARFSDDKAILSPPSLNISFDDEDSDNNALLKYILDTGLVTEEKASKKIEEFTQSAFNKLINVDAFSIEGIGKIVKRVGQEKVEFEPNLSELTREFQDLTPLKFSPITRIAEQSSFPVDSGISQKVEESGSFLPRIIILSLALIALYFIGEYLYNSYKEELQDEPTEIIDQENPENQATKAELNEKELQQKYEEIDELIDPIKKNESVEKDDSKINEELNHLEANGGAKKNSNENGGGVIESNDTNASTDWSKDISKSKSIKSSLKIKTRANKHAAIIPTSGECIIVVGSFIKSLNAINMVSQLERKGYKVYQNQYKGFSRVGIIYECADEDLEAYLQNIRKKISKRAWYLDPDLEVPYLR